MSEEEFRREMEILTEMQRRIDILGEEIRRRRERAARMKEADAESERLLREKLGGARE